MKNFHLLINLFSFITIIIALFFGMSIFNAYDNQHITHLNLQEANHYYDISEVPVLTAKAVIFTLVFMVLAFGLQIYTFIKTSYKKRKNIIIALLPIYFIIFGFSWYLLLDTTTRDFYTYGMIWVLLNLCLIFGNSLLLFIKAPEKN